MCDLINKIIKYTNNITLSSEEKLKRSNKILAKEQKRLAKEKQRLREEIKLATIALKEIHYL